MNYANLRVQPEKDVLLEVNEGLNVIHKNLTELNKQIKATHDKLYTFRQNNS